MKKIPPNYRLPNLYKAATNESFKEFIALCNNSTIKECVALNHWEESLLKGAGFVFVKSVYDIKGQPKSIWRKPPHPHPELILQPG